MKKNPAFEHWIADHLMDGMIMMEPYGYREDESGNFLHIFRISLQFEDEPSPFEGVAFIPIPFKKDDSCTPQQVADSFLRIRSLINIRNGLKRNVLEYIRTSIL